MGWFYEVDITNDILSGGYERLEDKDGKIIVQGKNSSFDYAEYYMENGEPYRYENINNLMKDIEGYSTDLKLITDYSDINTSNHEFTYFSPVFFSGNWYVDEN